MAENFLNLNNETTIQVQEAQRVPYKMNQRRPTPRHIIIKKTKVKVKERNFRDRKRETNNNMQVNLYKSIR